MFGFQNVNWLCKVAKGSEKKHYLFVVVDEHLTWEASVNLSWHSR